MNKVEKDVIEKASDLQAKLAKQRQNQIDKEKKDREKALAEHQALGSEDNKERVKKGLEALGLEGRKTKNDDEIEKRKAMMANLKGLIK